MDHHLILGGTGTTGRRIARLLSARGEDVVTAARTPGPAGPGVTPVHLDWDDPATWDAPLAGARSLYVVPPALVVDVAPVVTRMLERAGAAGVGRVVLLSARGADHAPGSPLDRAEAATRASGIPWAVVRPTWFMQNFSEGIHAAEVAGGRISAPTGVGAVPFVDADDIAAVAVALLAGDAPLGRAYDLSGPSALTMADVARLIGDAAGFPVVHDDADPDRWEAEVRAAGLPADYAALLTMLYGIVRSGADAALSDGVAAATGRAPGSFAAFAAREAGAWQRAA